MAGLPLPEVVAEPVDGSACGGDGEACCVCGGFLAPNCLVKVSIRSFFRLIDSLKRPYSTTPAIIVRSNTDKIIVRGVCRITGYSCLTASMRSLRPIANRRDP